MYVCNCHKVTDSQITTAMKAGVKTLSELQKELNVGTNCGSCLEHAEIVMQQFKDSVLELDFSLAFQAA